MPGKDALEQMNAVQIAFAAGKIAVAEQLIEMKLGLRDRFDIRDVGIKALGQGINARSGFPQDHVMASGFFRTLTDTALSSVIYGRSPSIETFAANYIGNTLGEALRRHEDEVKRQRKEMARERQEKQQAAQTATQSSAQSQSPYKKASAQSSLAATASKEEAKTTGVELTAFQKQMEEEALDWYVNESWDKMREMGFGNELAGFGSGSYPTVLGEQNTSPVAQKFGNMTSKYARILGINKSVMAPVVTRTDFEIGLAQIERGLYTFNAFMGWTDEYDGLVYSVTKGVYGLIKGAVTFRRHPFKTTWRVGKGISIFGWDMANALSEKMGKGETLGAQQRNAVRVARIQKLYDDWMTGDAETRAAMLGSLGGEVILTAGTGAAVSKVGMFAKGAGRVGIAQKVPGVLSKTKGVSFWSRTVTKTESIPLTPMEQLNKALQQSRIYEQLDKIPASSANAARALSKKLSILEGMQSRADGIEILSNGSVRYYDKFRSAKTTGSTVGSRFIVEHNPSTNMVTTWNETYDQLGAVNRVHLKSINGITINTPHFPPTLNDVLVEQIMLRPGV